LHCYPANATLEPLDDGVTIKSDSPKYVEISGKKLFTIANITVAKDSFDKFYQSGFLPTLTATPKEMAYSVNDKQDKITSIQLTITTDEPDKAFAITLVVNPSPPARSTS
jgi:hypothetical protein